MKKKILIKEAEKIVSSLKTFSVQYHSVFPEAAVECLSGFLGKPEIAEPTFFKPNSTWESGNVQFALTSLAAFQSEFDYIIADTQYVARRIIERAFIHLQRCIVVDDDVRDKWKKAFNSHETKCEKLGALHLLHHGVWAFKADASGGRTDLILSEPLPSPAVIEGSADTLVLTEWKLVKSSNMLPSKITEAQKQAEIYGSDVLGGIEIRNFRYLIMVSDSRLQMPDDIIKDGTTYRHINIAVDPGTPSEESKK
ncbi:MAG: hypothetical protein KAR18_00575 [Spirochaetes bacterium]|nr:hypothetical protein [Spirochaetota bacterium]